MKRLIFLLLIPFFSLAQNPDPNNLFPNVGFVENKGQLRNDKGESIPEILYQFQGQGLDIYVTTQGLSYVFNKLTKREEKSAEDDQIIRSRYIEQHRVDVQLLNAKINPQSISSFHEIPQGYFNYFYAHCPKGVKEVKMYKKILIKDIYPGIDWELYANGRFLKHNFLVHSGADPSLIKMKYDGATPTLSADQQNITFETKLGSLTEGSLYCYQGDKSETIKSSYELIENSVIFKLAHYQIDQLLIIDPPLLWATYYGGAMLDGAEDIHTDAAGNVYVVGYVSSSSFPTMDGGGYYNPTITGQDAFIIKFDNNGVRQWATFFGGNQVTKAEALSVTSDPTGNVFITGKVSDNDLVTANPGGGAYYRNTFTGSLNSAFIAKFDAASNLLWSTYYGGTKSEIGYSINADNNGNVFVVGKAGSFDLDLANPGGGAYYQTTIPNMSGFILKFDNNLALEWGTYYGGSGIDRFYSSCVDNNGNLFVNGYTASTDLPVANLSPGAYYQGTKAGQDDAFILKFNNNGVRQWATYFGGSDDEGYHNSSNFIDTDNNGNVYITGHTLSTDLPLQNPGSGAHYQTANAGGQDLFFGKFSNAGVQLWTTYYGGPDDEWGTGIAADHLGNVYGGAFSRAGTPTLNPGAGVFFQGTNAGMLDAFIIKFDNNLTRTWATYYGGSDGDDWVEEVTVDDNGCLFVTGEWKSYGMPTTDPGGGAYYQDENGALGQAPKSDDDISVLKFCEDVVMSVNVNGTDLDCYGDSTGTLVATPVGGTPGYTYDWQPGNYTDSLATGIPAGTYTVTVTDTDNNTATGTVTITEPDSLYLDPLADIFICPGETASFTASANGGTPNYNFLWNGSVAGASFSDNPLVDTSYSVLVTDDNGCTDTASVNIIISPSVIATVSPDTFLCSGGKVTLSASGGSTYAWTPTTSLDDAASATPIASPTIATTYTVIVSSGSCDPDTQTVFVDVTELVALASGNTVICNGDSIGLSASGGSGYQWLGTNIDDPSSSTPIVWPSTTTTYSVIVSDTGCTDDTAIVTVNVVPNITANISPDTAICEGESVTLTASGGSAYSWSPAASLSDTTGSSVVATPIVSTSYSVTVTSGSCAPASNSVNITVHPLPTVSLGQDTSIETGESIILSAPAGGSYAWSPGDGLDDPSSASPVASPSTTTTYTLTYTDANGCVATDEITITVSDECGGDGGLFIPSAFTPNGDGVNDEFKVRYVPDCVEIISFVVYDRWGEKVFEAESNEGWNGTYRNNYLNSAVFDYYLEALLFDGEKIIKSGNVSLIR